jgi:hypothetical protein
VASAAAWLYGLGTLVPVALSMLALRLLWLHRQSSIAYSAQGTLQPGQVASQE